MPPETVFVTSSCPHRRADPRPAFPAHPDLRRAPSGDGRGRSARSPRTCANCPVPPSTRSPSRAGGGGPEDWLCTRRAARPPAVAMTAYAPLDRPAPGRPMFVTDPAEPDYLFLYWYLHRSPGTGRSPGPARRPNCCTVPAPALPVERMPDLGADELTTGRPVRCGAPAVPARVPRSGWPALPSRGARRPAAGHRRAGSGVHDGGGGNADGDAPLPLPARPREVRLDGVDPCSMSALRGSSTELSASNS